MKHVFFLFGCFLLSVHTFGQTSYTIQEAIDLKYIDYTLCGNWDPSDKKEFQDAEGQYFGKCMSYHIQNKMDSTFYITIDNGLMLLCEDTFTQNMVITKTIRMELGPKQNKTGQLYAMCSDMLDGIPNKQSSYHVGKPGSKELCAITKTIEEMYMHNVVGQGAVWAITNQAGEDELRNFGATDASLAMTIQVLNKAGITSLLNPTLSDEINGFQTAVSSENRNKDDITLNANVFYVFTAILLCLLASTLYLILKNKKNKHPKG